MSVEADKTNKKVITVSFVVAAFLAHVVTRVVFETLGGMFSFIERWRSVEALKHGIPLAAAAVTFLVLQLNPKILDWADEVSSEIRKIVWPSRKDTTVTTTAVCVMVVVAGLGFAAIDYVSSQLITMIVK